jgi:hypothetical protein
MTLTPEPFDAAVATNAVVNGELVYGYALGVRVRNVDGILFAPSYVSLMRLAAYLPGDAVPYGLDKIDNRKVLVNETQLTTEPIPVPEVKEVTMKAWDDTQPGVLL